MPKEAPMLIPYTSPASPFKAELTIQKSLFIAHLAPVTSMEEAANFWKAEQKTYRDATHHCFACRIGTGQVQEKSSDDGEPQGTAGHPMLHVLQMQDLTDAALVVTRYFGGIKLGAGGLTRAYSNAATLAINGAPLTMYTPHIEVQLTLPYDALGAFERYAADTDMRIEDRAFTDTVTLALLVPPASWPAYEKDLTNMTAGRIGIEMGKERYVGIPADG